MRPCDGRVFAGPVVPAAEPAPRFFATELTVREVVPFANIVREGADPVDGALDLECRGGLTIFATLAMIQFAIRDVAVRRVDFLNSFLRRSRHVSVALSAGWR